MTIKEKKEKYHKSIMNELDSPILDLQPFLKHAGQIFPEERLLFLVNNNNNNNNNNNKIIIIITTTTTIIIIIIIPYLPVYIPWPRVAIESKKSKPKVDLQSEKSKSKIKCEFTK